MYVCTYVCMYVSIYLYIYIYIHIFFVYVCVCMYVCMYVCDTVHEFTVCSELSYKAASLAASVDANVSLSALGLTAEQEALVRAKVFLAGRQDCDFCLCVSYPILPAHAKVCADPCWQECSARSRACFRGG